MELVYCLFGVFAMMRDVDGNEMINTTMLSE